MINPLCWYGGVDHLGLIMPISSSGSPPFTPLQGQYLTFIYAYTKLNRRAPAEADIQHYFATTAPTVHRMVILALERAGLISRVPGKARSIQLQISPDQLPVLR